MERAFQLAASGACHSVDDIRERPRREHYEGILSHLAGGSIQAQLKVIIGDATEAD